MSDEYILLLPWTAAVVAAGSTMERMGTHGDA